MAVSRRAFVRALGVGGAGALTLPAWVSARGLEAATASPAEAARLARARAIIRLHSNENPNGPVPAAIRAMTDAFHTAAHYPASTEGAVRAAIASANGVAADQVMLGSGSGEILRLAVQAFCSPTRHLVTAAPSFETPAQYARTLGLPFREVPLDAGLAIDLDRMARESRGAGLVFLCNPNNPTGHVHGKERVDAFIRAVLAADAEVVILVDEAYHEFVDDPSYASALPLIATQPRVFISRTFSKIYGLAGMRVGYAFGQPATLGRMERLRLANGVGALAQAAAIASLGEPAQMRREQELNREARAFTTRWFTEAGFSVMPSQTNFVLVDIRRDGRQFRDSCLTEGIAVGRPFPPLTNHTRISIGTMAEMRQAVAIFRRVLV
ncbi:MAG: aminotransferase class I/II-fold pyridoxal phosphate-dependent enzyme [Gemmatimonadaceae bacterium]